MTKADESPITTAAAPPPTRRTILGTTAMALAAASIAPAAAMRAGTIGTVEVGDRRSGAAASRAALEAAGVEFIAENGGGAGVRLPVSGA